MMKHGCRILLLALLLLAAAGCRHTSTMSWSKPLPGQRSSDGLPVVWNLRGYNCGVFLFYWIPIWSGESTSPNRREYELFQNMVGEWDMHRMFTRQLGNLEADEIRDVKVRTSSTGRFGLWIFWRRAVTATGVAVKKEKSGEKNRD